jgi:hypothetical protein
MASGGVFARPVTGTSGTVLLALHAGAELLEGLVRVLDVGILWALIVFALSGAFQAVVSKAGDAAAATTYDAPRSLAGASAHHALHHRWHPIPDETGDLACVLTTGPSQSRLIRALGDDHPLPSSIPLRIPEESRQALAHATHSFCSP